MAEPMVRTNFKWDQKSRVDQALEDEREAARLERQYNAEIDRRDRRQCRACGKHSDPEAIGLTTRGHRAHIVYASAGGGMEPHNRVTLCASCHSDEHKNRLRFSEDGSTAGIDANLGMEFWRRLSRQSGFYLSRRELAPHVVERD